MEWYNLTLAHLYVLVKAIPEVKALEKANKAVRLVKANAKSSVTETSRSSRALLQKTFPPPKEPPEPPAEEPPAEEPAAGPAAPPGEEPASPSQEASPSEQPSEDSEVPPE